MQPPKLSGGKTVALLSLFTLLSKIYAGSRWVIVRKDIPTIKRNLYPSWEKVKPSNFIEKDASDSNQQTVTFTNGSQLIFFAENFDTDKDLNRWKGLETNGIGFEEINECQQQSLFKAFERAGSYVIPNATNQPKPIVCATCNPSFGWVRDLVYLPYKEYTLKTSWHYIQSRIYDNIPLLEAQPDYLPSLKANLNRYEYEVFVEGNWDVQLKTGGEFLRKFELDKHVKYISYNPNTTVHISIDSNVYPYIAITIWQLEKINNCWNVRQIEEIPCEDPYNTSSQAGKKVASWLNNIKYTGSVYLYGDKSTKNRNNIDDNKRSFFQIFLEQIQQAKYKTVDKFLSHAPSVSSIGDFLNAILDGEIKEINIEIGEHCKKSISDYIETKTDKDGTMLKARTPHPTIKGVTMEKNGHLLDSFKDFIVQCFYEQYRTYLNRFNQEPKTAPKIISRTEHQFTM